MNSLLLGTGRQAKRLIDAIDNTESKIVAINSRDTEHGQRFIEANEVSKDIVVFDDLEKALSLEPVEAVVIGVCRRYV
ncbi:MAG: hypothetical protein ABFQ95_08320 [Pseudomonadota bacterium]